MIRRKTAAADIVRAISGGPSPEIWFSRVGFSLVPTNGKGLLLIVVGGAVFAALGFGASKTHGPLAAGCFIGAFLDVALVFVIAGSHTR